VSVAVAEALETVEKLSRVGVAEGRGVSPARRAGSTLGNRGQVGTRGELVAWCPLGGAYVRNKRNKRNSAGQGVFNVSVFRSPAKQRNNGIAVDLRCFDCFGCFAYEGGR